MTASPSARKFPNGNNFNHGWTKSKPTVKSIQVMASRQPSTSRPPHWIEALARVAAHLGRGTSQVSHLKQPSVVFGLFPRFLRFERRRRTFNRPVLCQTRSIPLLQQSLLKTQKSSPATLESFPATHKRALRHGAERAVKHRFGTRLYAAEGRRSPRRWRVWKERELSQLAARRQANARKNFQAARPGHRLRIETIRAPKAPTRRTRPEMRLAKGAGRK